MRANRTSWDVTRLMMSHDEAVLLLIKRVTYIECGVAAVVVDRKFWGIYDVA